MFNKLRTNYNLSNVLVRIFFVLAVMLSIWQEMLGYVQYSSAILIGNMQEVVAQMDGTAKLASALVSSAVVGVALMFLVPALAGLFLNVCRIYTVPRAEFSLLVNLFCSIGFFINGLLNLINLITPVFMVWGDVIFPFIITLCGFISFYFVTAKMYFNDVTKVHYFKCLSVVALVVLVLEVI